MRNPKKKILFKRMINMYYVMNVLIDGIKYQHSCHAIFDKA